MKITTKFWIGLAVLAVLSPLGLLFPEHFKSGSAWGEWGVDGIQKLVGYIPKGLEKFSSLWSAPIPNYAFKGKQGAGLLAPILGYIASALIGIFVVAGLAFLFAKFLSKKNNL
jgi:hypothetical protein